MMLLLHAIVVVLIMILLLRPLLLLLLLVSIFLMLLLCVIRHSQALACLATYHYSHYQYCAFKVLISNVLRSSPNGSTHAGVPGTKARRETPPPQSFGGTAPSSHKRPHVRRATSQRSWSVGAGLCSAKVAQRSAMRVRLEAGAAVEALASTRGVRGSARGLDPQRPPAPAPGTLSLGAVGRPRARAASGHAPRPCGFLPSRRQRGNAAAVLPPPSTAPRSAFSTHAGSSPCGGAMEILRPRRRRCRCPTRHGPRPPLARRPLLVAAACLARGSVFAAIAKTMQRGTHPSLAAPARVARAPRPDRRPRRVLPSRQRRGLLATSPSARIAAIAETTRRGTRPSL